MPIRKKCVGKPNQTAQPVSEPNTAEDEFEDLLQAVEEKGKKLRPRDLVRLITLLSIGSLLTVIALTVTISGGAFGLGMKWSTRSGGTTTRINGEVGWGSLQGAESVDSFLDGGDATKLSGTWHADWWVDLADGGEERYSYLDAHGQRIPYPTEDIFVQAHKAVVSCKVKYASGEDIRYWYEGRLSAGNHVTLLYWVERGDGRENLVGVVFLSFAEGMKGNQPSKLLGRWIGYVRDGKQVEGRTKWTKQD